MADEVWQDFAAALSSIVSTTDKSWKMEKELKNTISETVSTLRKLLVKLKNISESKTKAISDLETAVTKMRALFKDGREKGNKGRAAPSVIPTKNQQEAEPRGRHRHLL
jgi:predicted  nucleic acid-binding Zn-ribbon protein